MPQNNIKLRELWAYISANPGCTLRQIGKAMGWRSTNTVNYWVTKLIGIGHVTRILNRKGTLRAIIPFMDTTEKTDD